MKHYKKISIYYDGFCPFCSNYVSFRRASVNRDIQLVDVRQDNAVQQYWLEKGYNLDEGMVIVADDEIFYGSMAFAFISSLKGSSLGSFMLRFPVVAAIMYWFLRIGRNFTLWIAGRPKIHNQYSRYGNVLTIFSFAWAIFSLLHFLVYAFQFRTPLYFSTYLIPVVGFGLLFRPDSRRMLLLSVIFFMFDAWLQAPASSNHTILKNFLLLAIVLSAIFTWFAREGEDCFYKGFAPVGRCLLLIMYIFGVFHKINTDFLNPEVSCAAELWKKMPFYTEFLGSNIFIYTGIYGTLIIETVVLFLLLSTKGRLVGVVVGVAFHSLLALSDYALYAPFSMLTVTLHLLFISPESANAIVTSSRWIKIRENIKKPIFVLFISSYLAVATLLAWLGQYWSVGLFWILAMLPVYIALFLPFKHSRHQEYSLKQTLIARPLLLNVVTLLFFLNCYSPYLGLKTAQSMNMFANLRLEGNDNNHLIMRYVPATFGYLSELVKIVESDGSVYLNYIKDNNLHLTYYAFVDHLEKNPHVSVIYERDGQRYTVNKYDDLDFKEKSILHPAWVRKWFHFMPVDLVSPKACSLNR